MAQRPVTDFAHAAEFAQAAAALAAAGKDAEADAAYAQGMARFPGDARLANSAGNFHARARRDARALALFERALALQPDLAEAAVNAAIVLLRMGRPSAAEAILAPHENGGGAGLARFWSLRAESAKALGAYPAADAHLRRAEALEPANARTRQARARLSLERGEARALAEYESVLAQAPGNFALMHGYVLALQAQGLMAEALDFAQALAAAFPSWIEGQAALAELRWAAGETASYTAHFEAAASAHPAPETYLEWARLLSGNDRHADAAAVLGRAQTLWPGDRRLALDRAIALGEAGEAAQADAILAGGETAGDADWALARARNDLRLGRVDAARTALEALVAADIDAVGAWSLLDVCWRLTGDARHDWLHGQLGLVRAIDLPLDPAQLSAIRQTLRALHAGAAIPLAQSVKGGTQTHGALFARLEPELATLREALDAVIAEYRSGLPPADPTHPLLARRDADWTISGSWSVRFEASGRHAAHIHPLGVLSSACYLVVPAEVGRDGKPGWLELGAPPEGIAPQLGALASIKPREGMCALFPSTLFHGTRPIGAGERMTVAFDVTVQPG